MSDQPWNDRMQAIRWRMSHETFRFSDEIRVIPRWFFVLIVVLYVVAMVVLQIANAAEPVFPDLGRFSALALAGVTTAVGIGAAIILSLFCYIYFDARRRRMKAILWLLLAVFVPNLIGIIIYFLLRDPLPFKCQQCGAPLTAYFNFCPNCSHNLRPTCPRCKREVEPGSRYCSNCAYDLSETKPTGGEPATPAAPGAPA